MVSPDNLWAPGLGPAAGAAYLPGSGFFSFLRMEALLPLAFATVAGMGHAFEADHLLAVSSIVSRRDTLSQALRDGLYWGLGHTTTLVVLGSVILLSRATFLHSGWFEVIVGLMLIGMGASRLFDKNTFSRRPAPVRYQPGVAYTVGLVHGLAGSGALVLLVMSEIRGLLLGVTYLLVFGLGSVLGMLSVAALLSIPFTRRMRISFTVRAAAIVLSSLICIGYGGWMVLANVKF